MIAIKDIEEMPSCCYECPYFDDYCALTGKWECDTEQIRDNDCPLVEIVTCKDCKHYYQDEDGRGYHCERDSNVRFSVHRDFYCAYAESEDKE